MRQKYKNVRKNKAIKLAKLKDNEQVIAENTDKRKEFTKSAQITAKKISEKYKKISNKNNINIGK